MVLILILILAVVKVKATAKYCDVTGEDPVKQCYTKEVLVSVAHSPNQIAVDKDNNNVYFSFDSGQGEYTAAIFKMDTKEMSVLKGVKDAFAMATDDVNKVIYFGGTHGIYKYDPNKYSLKRLNMNHLDVWWLFVKQNLYFIKFPSLNTYYYSNGSITIVEALKGQIVHQMVVDADDHLFFINNTGLYGLRNKENKTPILIKDNARFINMALDNKGHVYVCTEDGISVISKMIFKVKKVLNIQGVLGLAFDSSNNIIYTDSHEIVRLIPILKI